MDAGGWPHRDASRFVESEGLRWHVQVFGDGPDDLLLVHGTGASTHSFRALAPLLATRYRVFVPDLPGHARTAMPPAARMGVGGMARALAALLDALDARPALAIGHSAGAAVLVRMALDGRRFDGIVGLNAALVPLGGVLKVFSPMAKVLASAPGVPRLFSAFARDPRAVQRLVDSTGSTLDAEGSRLYADLVRDRAHVAGALAMMAAWNLDRTWAQLASLRTPLLLLAGSNDRTVPSSHSRAAAARAPHASVDVLDGLGHLAHEEAPGRIAADVLAFAERLGVGQAVANRS